MRKQIWPYFLLTAVLTACGSPERSTYTPTPPAADIPKDSENVQAIGSNQTSQGGTTKEEQATIERAEKAYAAGDYATAFKLYTPMAEKGWAWFQHRISLMYLDGEGVKQSNKEAITWLTKSADQGFPPALTELARLHISGKIVQKDIGKSLGLLRRAAEAEEPEAIFMLSAMYQTGSYVKRDPQEAHKWMEKLVNHKYSMACVKVALDYSAGDGVEQDYAKAYAFALLAKYFDNWEFFAETKDNEIARNVDGVINDIKNIATKDQLDKGKGYYDKMVKLDMDYEKKNPQ